MTAIAGGKTSFTGIDGVTTDVLAASGLAYRQAYLDAYRTIFYVSIAFGGLNIICNIGVPNIEKCKQLKLVFERLDTNLVCRHDVRCCREASQSCQTRRRQRRTACCSLKIILARNVKKSLARSGVVKLGMRGCICFVS